MPLPEGAKIYVAGHRGLVGSAIYRRLAAEDRYELITRGHSELELTEQADVRRFFEQERPGYVVIAAAKVGGIMANATYPADFILQNLLIQTNIIQAAWQTGVERLLFLGSSCIYPKMCPQPMKEEHLLTGPLEPTNRPYAVAKIAGIELCWGLNRQYGTKYLCVMPTNVYGKGDNYNLETGHVLPALIRRFHDAKTGGAPDVTLWGTGSPFREFILSDDLADACVHLLGLESAPFDALISSQDRPPLVNIGVGKETTIAALAALVAEVVGYTGEIVWDSSKPDGTPRKLLDVSLLASLGWQAKTRLRDGIEYTYGQYLKTL